MKNIKKSENIKLFKSSIIKFELEEFNKDDLRSCIINHKNNTSDDVRECHISIKSLCDIKFHFVVGGCSIYHYKVYEDGYGSEILSTIENALQKVNCKNLHIWIGTEQGGEKTEKFLKKNNFSEIYTEKDEAHGITFHGEKSLN